MYRNTLRDHDSLKKWTDGKFEVSLKFKCSCKCRVLNLGRNNPRHQYRLAICLLESSSAENDLGVLLDTELNIGQQCVLVARKANGTMGCFRKVLSTC